MADRKSFIFYTEYREQLSMLPAEQVGELVFALMDYQETGTLPELPKGSALAMCFSFIKSRIDKDNAKYEETCERNKENGKKGGRPAKEPVSEQTDIKTKETDIKPTEDNTKPSGFSENRTVFEETDQNPTKPNGFSETQQNPTKPKKPDNDNDNDNDLKEYLRTPLRARAREEAGESRKESAPESVTYSDDPELNDAIMEFIRTRKSVGKPMSDRAVTLMLNKLNSLSHDKREQIQILEQSIMQGWTGIYELKDDRNNKNKGHPRHVNPNGFAGFSQRDSSAQLDELEKVLADELNKTSETSG